MSSDAAIVASSAAAATAFDASGVECDSAEAEEVDIMKLLLDPWAGRLPGLAEGVSAFAVAHNASLLAAWRKQPSPCCAAAALAGAVNALGRVRREDDRALGPLDVLCAMRRCLRRTVAGKIASYERKLGAPLAPLLDALRLGETGGGTRAWASRVRAVIADRADSCSRAVAKERERERHAPPPPPANALAAAAAAAAAVKNDVAPPSETTCVTRGGSTMAAKEGAVPGPGAEPPPPEAAAEEEEEEEAVPGVFRRLWELYDEEAARKRPPQLKDDAVGAAQAPPLTGLGDFLDDEDDAEEDEDDEEDGEPAAAPAKEDDEEDDDAPAALQMMMRFFPTAVPPDQAPVATDGAAPLLNEEEPTAPRRPAEKKPRGRPSRKLGAARRNARPWAWKRELATILHQLDGIAKTLQARPSTAAFGNWGIIQAATELRSAAARPVDGDDAGGAAVDVTDDDAVAAAAAAAPSSEEPFLSSSLSDPMMRWQPSFASAAWRCPKVPPCAVAVRNFVGLPFKGSKAPYVALRRADGEAEIEAQWGKVKAAFADPRVVLIFHLKNHYALIFALRDWVDVVDPEVNGTSSSSSSKARVRQMLTARKGQRPTEWIDWVEARQTIIGWAGYKMLTVARMDDDEDAAVVPVVEKTTLAKKKKKTTTAKRNDGVAGASSVPPLPAVDAAGPPAPAPPALASLVP